MKVIYKAPDELMALTIRDLLQQSGVPVWLRSFGISGYGNLAKMLYPHWGELLVEELDYERALEIIDGFFSGEVVAEDIPSA